MSDQSLTGTAKFSTAGGFLSAICLNIRVTDLLSTAITAAVGALVSFGMSMLLKYCLSRWRK